MRTTYSICLVLAISVGCREHSSPGEDAGASSPPQIRKDEGVQGEQPFSLQDAVRQALSAPMPHGPQSAAKLYGELFSYCTEARLRELACHPDLSIALQARWELRDSGLVRQFNPAHRGHFPGFLEGEGGLRIPMSWAVDFAGVWFHDPTNRERSYQFYREAGYPGLREEEFTFVTGEKRRLTVVDVLPKFHRTSFGPLAPAGIEVAGDAERVHIRIGDRSIQVARDLFPKQDRADGSSLLNCQVAATIKSERLYLAVYRDDFAAFPLLCIDAASGRILWHVTVWAVYSETVPSMSGPTYHDVQLVCDGERIAVFGRSTCSGFYIESFDVQSGKNLLRFSTSWWNLRGAASYTIGVLQSACTNLTYLHPLSAGKCPSSFV